MQRINLFIAGLRGGSQKHEPLCHCRFCLFVCCCCTVVSFFRYTVQTFQFHDCVFTACWRPRSSVCQHGRLTDREKKCVLVEILRRENAFPYPNFRNNHDNEYGWEWWDIRKGLRLITVPPPPPPPLTLPPP